MDPKLIIELGGFLFTLCSAANVWMNLQIKSTISDLKVEMERGRSADRDTMREWVEQRFVRLPVLTAVH